MAQKYLVAFDHVNLHANNVLRKHATKRPLGDIETRHRYTPVQPVLSCRTVDVDVSGTRTYRPKSSADIINEQHALIHRIYTKARNVASAPPKRTIKSPRNFDDENTNNEQKSNTNLQSVKIAGRKPKNVHFIPIAPNVEVQGRPLTSSSQRPRTGYERRKPQTSARRPKTTGRIKNNKTQRENFLFLKNNKRDFIQTQRSYRDLTEKIHQQWQPSNHDLNSGTYQRGKKQPDIKASVDSWLTFSGSQTEESRGLVDAFAAHVPSLHGKLESIEEELDEEILKNRDETHLDNAGQFYNIEGGVGSRIAHQLQKGDKIRIGINGSVQTQDLKVKKWVKEDSYVKEMDPEASPEEKLVGRMVPLCWEDQVQGTTAKVMTPRGPRMDKSTINLCETRPVIFNKLLPEDSSQQVSTSNNNKRQGFRVKQRRKNKSGVDGKVHENKVTVLTIDAATEEEDQKVESLTVDDVLKQGFHGKPGDKGTKHSVEFSDSTDKFSVSFNLIDNNSLHDSAYNHSKSSIAESVSSDNSDLNRKHPKIKPSQPTFSAKHQTNKVDLDIVGTLTLPNGSRPPSEMAPLSPGPIPKSAQTRCGSARSSRSRQQQRSAVAPSSIISLGSQSSRVEAEFIQISHPVKNPNPVVAKKPADYVKQNITIDLRSQRTHSSIEGPVPTPDVGNYEKRTEHLSPPVTPVTPTVKGTSKPTTPSLAINIPTAEYTDSALNSPSHKNVTEVEGSPQDRREKDMRDEQIDQITTLLGDSIIGQNESQAPTNGTIS